MSILIYNFFIVLEIEPQGIIYMRKMSTTEVVL